MNSKNNRVEWVADQGVWLISEAAGNPPRNLEDWAEEQTEMSNVSLMLSATNYATQWVSLPGVKGRHLNRALPFALEDVLIRDIGDYTVVPGGSIGGKHKAYVVESDLIDRLIELLAIHHLRLSSLQPETAGYTGCQMVRAKDGWLISLEGVFEGWVPDSALPAVLDGVGDKVSGADLTIYASSMDEGNLLKTTISSGYPDSFDNITVSTGKSDPRDSTISLLQGKAASAGREKKPTPWWAGIASFAAVFAIFACGFLVVENHRTSEQIEMVSSSSKDLYKRWFPGESTSNYESKFRRKLRSGSDTSDSPDFDSKGAVSIQSIRYSERIGEFLLDVDAQQQSDLQALKAAIEARGLTAEISSAKADKDIVKGRLKVGGAA
jgi:general secretion pathway protein L